MTEAVGFLAASLVFAAFSMRSMLWLRLTAIASNVAFIVYGLSMNLAPIYVLHVLLLPINLLRLLPELRTGLEAWLASKPLARVRLLRARR